MFTLLPRGQPPNGDGAEGSDPGNANNTDPGSDSLLSNPDSLFWSASSEAIKWGIIASIFTAFLLFIALSTWHARRRMRNGMQPLRYHRWLITRQHRIQFTPRDQNNPSFYGHDMDPYAVPPPAYNAEHDYVPPYTPEDGSKLKTKTATTPVATEGGPSRPPPVANPSRPTYS